MQIIKNLQRPNCPPNQVNSDKDEIGGFRIHRGGQAMYPRYKVSEPLLINMSADKSNPKLRRHTFDRTFSYFGEKKQSITRVARFSTTLYQEMQCALNRRKNGAIGTNVCAPNIEISGSHGGKSSTDQNSKPASMPGIPNG